MSNVSLERYYFVLYDGALTLKMSKMALNAFCDKTLHLFREKCPCYFKLREIFSLPMRAITVKLLGISNVRLLCD